MDAMSIIDMGSLWRSRRLGSVFIVLGHRAVAAPSLPVPGCDVYWLVRDMGHCPGWVTQNYIVKDCHLVSAAGGDYHGDD